MSPHRKEPSASSEPDNGAGVLYEMTRCRKDRLEMLPTMIPIHERSAVRRATQVVLAVPDEQQADLLNRVLLRLGWTATKAETSAEVRQLLCESPGRFVAILGAELTDESGWLTCAKLMHPAGRATVFIVGEKTPRHRMMARTVGATAMLADPVEIADWLPPLWRGDSRN